MIIEAVFVGFLNFDSIYSLELKILISISSKLAFAVDFLNNDCDR